MGEREGANACEGANTHGEELRVEGPARALARRFTVLCRPENVRNENVSSRARVIGACKNEVKGNHL
eukprot:338309-Pleurochrysis_carterae.AAC.3